LACCRKSAVKAVGRCECLEAGFDTLKLQLAIVSGYDASLKDYSLS